MVRSGCRSEAIDPDGFINDGESQVKVRTDLKAGQAVYPAPENVRRVVASIVDLAKEQNSFVLDWANNMNDKSGQVWSAMTGQ